MRIGVSLCLVMLTVDCAFAEVLLGVRRLGNTSSPAVITIDPAVGTGEDLATPDNLFLLNSAASDNTNTVFVTGITSDLKTHLGTLNPLTGDIKIGPETNFPLASSNSTFGLAWHQDFGLIGSGLNSELVSINTITAEGTVIGQIGGGLDITALAFSPNVRLFGWALRDGRGLIEIDPTNATFTDVNPSVGLSAEIQALEFSLDGSILYGAREALYSIDIETGAATQIGSGDGITDIRGLAFVVPEPSSFAGLLEASAVFLQRRSRHSMR